MEGTLLYPFTEIEAEHIAARTALLLVSQTGPLVLLSEPYLQIPDQSDIHFGLDHALSILTEL